jgi:hypothetical protein
LKSTAPVSAADVLTDVFGVLVERSPEDRDAERIEDARREIFRATRVLRARLQPVVSVGKRWRELVQRTELIALAEQYEPARGSMLVLGPAGVGKTVALMALASRLLGAAHRAGNAAHPVVRARWATGIDIACAMRETRFGSSCDEMREAQRAPLLFLDEVGQELGDSRWLLELLDERYRHRRPTLTTSGLQLGQLDERYGTGAVRRLTEPLGARLDIWSTRGR